MITYWTFDRWGRQTGTVQDVLEAVHSDELNGEDSLTLTTPTCDLSKGDRIVWRDKFGEWHEHIVNDIKDEHADGALLSVVYCENSLAELYTDHIDDIRPSDVTAAVALGRVLDGTRWAVGIVTVTGTASTNVYHASAREGVSKVVEAWGGEVSTTITVSGTGVSGRALNLGRRGHDHGKRFEWSKDIQSVTREVLTDDVCTALYGYGKGIESYDADGNLTGGYERRLKFGEINGGLDYVADDTAKQLYGLPDGSGGIKHTYGRVVFEDCEDMAELLALTQAELDVRKHPQVRYTATVVDLADAGLDFEDVRTGDTVALIDHGLGERLQGRVLRVQRHLLDEGETVVTLGNLSRSITDELSRQLGLLNDIMAHTSAWDSSSSNTAEYVAAVIRSLNKVMNQTGGYVYMEPGEGIVTYDRAVDSNPTMVVKVTGGGIGIANSKLPNGNWDWKTLLVSGHIASELVTAVKIVAGFIGNVGGTYWDLDNGILNISTDDTIGGRDVSDVLGDIDAALATYGYCDTRLSGRVYVVEDCDGFELNEGAEIVVYFDIDHDGGYMSLDVNNTGTKAVMVASRACDGSNNLAFKQGSLLAFRYSAGAWWLTNPPGSIAGTCSSMASSQTKYVSVPDGAYYLKGTTLTVVCSTANTYASGALWLNVGDIQYGSYRVKVDGAATSSSNTLPWEGGVALTFVYDGESWVYSGSSDAAKTATNHLRFEANTGLKIAASNPDTATTYQLMTATSTGYYISGVLRNLLGALGMKLFDSNGNESNFFGDGLIELGKNTAAAVIKMCAGLLEIKHNAASGLRPSYGSIKAADGLYIESTPSSENGNVYAKSIIDMRGMRAYTDGIAGEIQLVAYSDTGDATQDGLNHTASVHISGGIAADGLSSPEEAYVFISNRYGDYCDAGNPKVESSSDTKTVASGTSPTTICSITLGPGVWLVDSYLSFGPNSAGYRMGGLVSNASDPCDHAWAPAPTSGGITPNTTVNMLHHRPITAQTTYYLVASQTSGSSLSVSGTIIATRLT